MDDIYVLSDPIILNKIGNNLKTLRLKQNITQQNLAELANFSLSSVKNIEKGEIRSFDSFLRILRTLGKLDVLIPIVEEEKLSPSQYYELVHSSEAGLRKRASGKIINKREESKW